MSAPNLMDGENALMRVVWPIMASLAGAITALSFRPFKRMSKVEIALALIVGTSFATFVGPLASHWVFGSGPIDIRILGGMFYLMASGSNILIPLGVKKLSSFFGVREGEEA